jgi:hypothetical protein
MFSMVCTVIKTVNNGFLCTIDAGERALERRMESEFFITVYKAITDGAISRKFLKIFDEHRGMPNSTDRKSK